MVLLVGTALFSRSLLHLVSIDPGFQTKNVVLLGADPTAAGYDNVRRVGFYREMLDRLGRVPGVESASLSWFPPMSDKAGSWTETVSIDGAPPAAGPGGQTYFNAVSAGYFGTLGIPVVRGRDFGPHDVASGPRTVIIDEALARAFFPGQDPIGRLLGVGAIRRGRGWRSSASSRTRSTSASRRRRGASPTCRTSSWPSCSREWTSWRRSARPSPRRR